MKNSVYILTLFVFVVLSGCVDYNDKYFDGLKEESRPSAKGPYEFEYTESVFSASKPSQKTLPDWLYAKVYTADEGATAIVSYDYSAEGTVTKMSDEYTFKGHKDKWTFSRTLLLKEDFTSGIPEGWSNFATAGKTKWVEKDYKGSYYVQYSAYKANGVCEGWLVLPKLALPQDMILSFDVCVGSYNDECLSVLISEDFNGENAETANWEDITDAFTLPQEPISGYGTFQAAGEKSLAAYAGKSVYIAFKYTGEGPKARTTTYQLDNIYVGGK